jgi:hypothetical protein
MALYKDIQTKSGFVLSYWRLTGIELNNEQKYARLIVTPYVSSDARQNGLLPVLGEIRRYTVEDIDYANTKYASRTLLDYSDHFTPEKLEVCGLDVYKAAYQYLKGLPEFEGAIDI